MARHVNGNLALKEQVGQEQLVHSPKPKRGRRNRNNLSERTLYIMMIIVFVVVATIVISRYAAIYELNLRTAQMQTDIEKLQSENNDLKIKMTKLADPESIMKDAQLMGLRELEVSEVNIIVPTAKTKQSNEVVSNQQ
jgi:cell division protein FtsL